jgi:hypothetical protein
MYTPIQLQTKSISRSLAGLILIAVALLCLVILPQTQAVNPPPDGGYPGGNTAEGQAALLALTTGAYNTAVGFYSLLDNTTGELNTAVGAATLITNTGDSNTAIGAGALFSNTTGDENTATGAFALFGNGGSSNTATGFGALQDNGNGNRNTAVGAAALINNVFGNDNTGTGYQALWGNIKGINNTAMGSQALTSNTADGNTAIGDDSLQNNTEGSENTATGDGALINNTTGNNNTADGSLALQFNDTGSGNIAVGNQAGINLITGDNNIYVGNEGGDIESGTIRIGTEGTHTATFIAGINGATASGGTAVFVDMNGQLGTVTSSARFKDNIKPMGKASQSVLALKPVTFRYKKEIDPAGTSQFGLVAEEVEKVNPSLVVRGKDGKPYSVRYEAVNAMLLNEFLKEHSKVEQQDHRIQKQDATIARLEKEIGVLTAGLQKVSAQLEVSKPAPQTVLNDQ